MTAKRIVIVGGGPAGINCAQVLASKLTPQDNVEVVVLEMSKFFFHAIGTPRAYTDPSFTNKLFIPYDNAIPAAARSFVKVVHAVVTKITQNEVSYRMVRDADDAPEPEVHVLAFDYLVVATGSTYTVPIKQDPLTNARADTEAKLKEVHEQIERAEKILVVGGGAVGVEVAGHIASKYPRKRVTILEARNKLIATNDLRDKFYRYLNGALAKLQIDVILGERLDERLTGNGFTKRTLTTDKGTVIESDIQLLCGGFAPVTQLIADMDAALVNARGFINVNDCMQFDGDAAYANMFALGDASSHPTPKLAYWAGEQGKHLANELVSVVRGKQTRVTKPYPKVTVEALILPLGPRGGVSQLPVLHGKVVGNTMTRMIKAKDMFAGKMWRDLGARMPAL